MADAGVLAVSLRADAPQKPPVGQPCNGCGVCCAVTPCPLGRLIYCRVSGTCPGLHWDGELRRYLCHPLSRRELAGGGRPSLMVRWLRRTIAAGIGCDFDASVEPDQ